MNKGVLLLILSFTIIRLTAQVDIIKDPVRKKEYKKVITQANQLYDNKQYAASIHFYKKALEVAPEKKLAKYRLEDIMTIFIKDELVENKQEAEELLETINETVQLIEDNLPEEKKDSLVYYLSDMDSRQTSKIDSRPESWIQLENAVREEMSAEINVAGDEPEVKKEKVEVVIVKEPEVINEKKEIYTDEKKEDKIVENSKIIKPTSYTEVSNMKSSVQLQAERIKIEEELIQQYPDEKTVEVIQEKHKKITRVIMNKNSKITVFLKVEHNWGGIFYFVDRTPFPVQSITKNYFITHTLIK